MRKKLAASLCMLALAQPAAAQEYSMKSFSFCSNAPAAIRLAHMRFQLSSTRSERELGRLVELAEARVHSGECENEGPNVSVHFEILAPIGKAFQLSDGTWVALRVIALRRYMWLNAIGEPVGMRTIAGPTLRRYIPYYLSKGDPEKPS